MSRARDEAKGVGNSRKAQGADRPSRTYVPFHPTAAEKEAIKAMDFTVEDFVEFLGLLQDKGLSLKVGEARDGASYYATVSEIHAVYPSGKALSAFHANPWTALTALCYALTVVHPAFPDHVSPTGDYNADW